MGLGQVKRGEVGRGGMERGEAGWAVGAHREVVCAHGGWVVISTGQW